MYHLMRYASNAGDGFGHGFPLPPLSTGAVALARDRAAHGRRGSRAVVRRAALAGDGRQARVPQLWLPDLLRGPPPERRSPVPLQGVPQGLLPDSGTLFAFHKLPLQTYLAAVAIFANEVKGKSALALSRDLDVQYKTAWVLAHKLREALAIEMKGTKLGGAGTEVEVDGVNADWILPKPAD
jgi:hypothetical protein